MIFLRLRKAFRKKHLISWTLAPHQQRKSQDGRPAHAVSSR